MKSLFSIVLLGLLVLVTGCETTAPRPYVASTNNVLAMQDKLKDTKVQLGDFEEAEKAGSLTCRLSGPVDVAKGKTQVAFIREALQTELFMAQSLKTDSDIILTGRLNSFSFSSVSPASWTFNFTMSSNKSEGYTVESKYGFKTSFSAYGACKNVADAYVPAIQQLIADIVGHQDFGKLIGK